jgi:hypothetical protein
MSTHDTLTATAPGAPGTAATHDPTTAGGHDHTTAARRMPPAVWAMVIGAFAMGADEFIVAGVVREIATALNVTIGAVGHLESA